MGTLLSACLTTSCAVSASETADVEVSETNAELESVVTTAAAVTVTAANDASRFLGQATFGPRLDDINALAALGSNEAWLKDQFGRTASSNLAYVRPLAPPTWSPTKNTSALMNTAFYSNALSTVAPLRQRVAFALSEIFVISFQNGEIAQRTAGVANYHDLLAKNAFGTYRQLLEAVSTNPMMGLYLSVLRNQKADPSRNFLPDENYAREVMQLFSIGLYELNNDGTLRRTNGAPVETYTQDDVSNLARVFTGWSWACVKPNTNPSACFNGSSTYTLEARDIYPMEPNQAFHSPEEIKFLGLRIEAKAEINDTLKRALDQLANHHNVGQFFGKQLIQRLVTSNPSAAYVQRVATAFNAGTFTSKKVSFGSGQRGDLQATIAAVLLDAEARDVNASARLREPVLRLTALMRAFDAAPDKAQGDSLVRVNDFSAETALNQTPYRSPTVFNFFRPGYTPPLTEIAKAGLVAPEFQISDEVSAAAYANFMQGAITNGVPTQKIDTDRDGVADTAFYAKLNLTPTLALADDPAKLVSQVQLLLTANRMSTATYNSLVAAVAKVPWPAATAAVAVRDAARLNRARLAIYLTVVSPDFLIQ